jgi:hypothetical protein
MTKYRVTILHDACSTHDVVAETPLGAVDAAMDLAHPRLCHQCSDELELGDPVRAATVENLETGEHDSEIDPGFGVLQLRARVTELEQQLAAAQSIASKGQKK